MENVDDADVEIDKKKQELEEARQVRRNRMEYDSLAKSIKEHPPRSETAVKLEDLTKELNGLKVLYIYSFHNFFSKI